MSLSPEVQAAIIKVAGDWSLALAKADAKRSNLIKYFKIVYESLAQFVEKQS